jgi:hypothetical protein
MPEFAVPAAWTYGTTIYAFWFDTAPVLVDWWVYNTGAYGSSQGIDCRFNPCSASTQGQTYQPYAEVTFTSENSLLRGWDSSQDYFNGVPGAQWTFIAGEADPVDGYIGSGPYKDSPYPFAWNLTLSSVMQPDFAPCDSVVSVSSGVHDIELPPDTMYVTVTTRSQSAFYFSGPVVIVAYVNVSLSVPVPVSVLTYTGDWYAVIVSFNDANIATGFCVYNGTLTGDLASLTPFSTVSQTPPPTPSSAATSVRPVSKTPRITVSPVPPTRSYSRTPSHAPFSVTSGQTHTATATATHTKNVSPSITSSIALSPTSSDSGSSSGSSSGSVTAAVTPTTTDRFPAPAPSVSPVVLAVYVPSQTRLLWPIALAVALLAIALHFVA